ncbi:hypothetical protein [Alteribacter populi]|uniref:hypothetical protein n=1 Tax=Alteribacter populi TaxID=2011011 RepID=UPI000BBA6B93|nr:hypothetical protein [Alteribacter populi]
MTEAHRTVTESDREQIRQRAEKVAQSSNTEAAEFAEITLLLLDDIEERVEAMAIVHENEMKWRRVT